MNTNPKVIVIDSIKQKQSKLRVCAYIRVSTSSEDQLHSFKTQLQYYQDHISSNEAWDLVDVYADEGVSGRSLENRDELNRLLADCRNQKIDRILIKSLSRLARNTTESLEIIRELRSLGISIYFEKENVDTSKATDEFLLTLYSQIAQEESISHSKNMRRSYKTRMEQGKFITCKAPFGYRFRDGTLIVQTDEAHTIQHIFSSYVNGKSIYDLIDELNSSDNSKQMKRWSYNSILYILKNEKYIGDSLTQKSYKQTPYTQYL